MLMHWMTLRACMHSVVSIPCMNIVCKTYMRDEAHWWCAHPQSWVITSRAQRTGRAENAEDGLWCERKDGLDKEKRKERTWTNQTDKSKQKKNTLTRLRFRHHGDGQRVNICAEVQRFPSVSTSPLQNEVSPYVLHAFLHRFTQSIIWAWLNTRSQLPAGQVIPYVCVYTCEQVWMCWTMSVCVCVCVCVTKETTTQSTATLGLMIHVVGRN